MDGRVLPLTGRRFNAVTFQLTRVRGLPLADVQTGQAQHIVDTVNLRLGLSENGGAKIDHRSAVSVA